MYGTFYAVVRAKTESCDEMASGGISADKATALSDEMRALTPLAGNEKVTDHQRRSVIKNDKSLSNEEADIAFFLRVPSVPNHNEHIYARIWLNFTMLKMFALPEKHGVLITFQCQK